MRFGTTPSPSFDGEKACIIDTRISVWSRGCSSGGWKLTLEFLGTFTSVSGAFHTLENMRTNGNSSTDDPIGLLEIVNKRLNIYSPVNYISQPII